MQFCITNPSDFVSQTLAKPIDFFMDRLKEKLHFQ